MDGGVAQPADLVMGGATAVPSDAPLNVTKWHIGRYEAIVAEEDAKAAMSAYRASERAVADDWLNDFRTRLAKPSEAGVVRDLE